MSYLPRKVKRRILINRDGGHCYYCRARLTVDSSTLDHVVPRALGGSNSLHNLRLACPTCNARKADKPPHVFIAMMMQGVA